MKDLKKIKKLLVVVDVINGFLNEGNLHDKRIRRIIEENRALIEEFVKGEDSDVRFFRDYHTADSAELLTFLSHCIAGTSETKVIEEYKEFVHEGNTYKKNSTSGIFITEYINDINAMENLTEIVITGCCTDLCVMNLAIPQKCYFNQINRNVLITVPENAVETYDIPGVHDADEYNDMAFKLMKLNGVNVVKNYRKVA